VRRTSNAVAKQYRHWFRSIATDVEVRHGVATVRCLWCDTTEWHGDPNSHFFDENGPPQNPTRRTRSMLSVALYKIISRWLETQLSCLCSSRFTSVRLCPPVGASGHVRDGNSVNALLARTSPTIAKKTGSLDQTTKDST
jgi:hypothetical protein